MEGVLQLVLNKLTTARDSTLQSSWDGDISVLMLQLPLSQFLTEVYAMELSSDQFVTVVYSVLKSASVEWLLPDPATSVNDDEVCERVYIDLSWALSRHACMQSLTSEEETCENLRKKFGEKAGVACIAMMTYSHLLSSLCNADLEQSCKRRIIRTLSHDAVLICLEHKQSCHWTTAQSVDCANSLLTNICTAMGCDTLESLLSMNPGKSGLLQHVMNEVLPKLSPTTWKLNPVACHVFQCCLLMTQQPLLSEFLPMFIPPALLFVDDFEAENRLFGLRCLQHIMRHSSRTELQWYGRANVIYDSLVMAMFGCDDVCLDAVIVNLFDVLIVVEASTRRAACLRPWSRHDEVFDKYLTNMEIENKVLLRRVYAKHLASFVSKLGITVVHHLSRLLRIVADYLQVSDGPEEHCRCSILEALSVILLETWPRVPSHADDVMKSLVCLLDDVRRQRDTMSMSTQASLRCKAVDCVELLKKICPEYTELTDDFFSQITVHR